MKRILALLMAAALLVCLAGCGKEEAESGQDTTAKAAKTAEAKGPFTFAGVGWDTPIGDCEAALEKATGVQFTNVDLDPDDPNYRDPTFFWNGATFAAVPGHYTILGMTIDATGVSAIFEPGIFACYTQPDDGAERQLEKICIRSNPYELPADPGTGWPDWSHLETAQEVFRKVDERYGDNTCVYLLGCNEDDGIMRYYAVPEKEFPYLFQDAAAFAEAMDWNYLCIGLVQDNVDFYIDVNFYGDDDCDWFCAMNLEYLGSPWAESEFAQKMAAEGLPFPWVDGKPVYVEIVP